MTIALKAQWSQPLADAMLGTGGAGYPDISRVAIPAAILFLLLALAIRSRNPAPAAASVGTDGPVAPAAPAGPVAPATPVAPAGAVARTEPPRPGPAAPASQRPRTALLTDPAQQMTAVVRVEFEPVRLFNRDAGRLLPAIEAAARAAGRGHRVMAQTNLADVLRPRHGTGSLAELQDAFTSLSSKRLDFAVLDGFGLLACAVEYEGVANGQGRPGKCDAVMREVLRRVGVPLVSVARDFDAAAVEQALTGILGAGRAAASDHRQTAVHM